MSESLQKLREDLTRIKTFLSDMTTYTLSNEEKESLYLKADSLSEKLEALSGRALVVGLLGGTGVGKSSLMNALAGTRVASTSHRRPHTDAVLVYHFEQTPLPATLPVSGVPWKEYGHTAETLRHVILCDLPDFDSLIDAHREQVVNFIEHLDILVWVTSPEKYADGKFYEFLEIVPKAAQNFYFLLNKTDLLFEGHTLDTGFAELKKLVASLEGHLVERGVTTPTVFSISATDAAGGKGAAPWNQFPVFAGQLFRERDIKEIKTIRHANLHEEVALLAAAFEKEMLHLGKFRKAVEDARAVLHEDVPDLKRAAAEKIAFLMNTAPLRSELVATLSNPSVLVGVSAAFGYFGWGRRRLAEDGEFAGHASLTAVSEEVAGVFKSQTDRMFHRCAGELLRRGIDAALVRKFDDVMEEGMRGGGDVAEKMRHHIAARIESVKKSSHLLFKGVQSCAYIVILVLLIFSLAGESAWKTVYTSPSVVNAINFLAAVLFALFSPRGLAALGSYLFINLFIGYRFYVRYRKILERKVDRFLASLQDDVVSLWEAEMELIIGRVDFFREEINAALHALASFKEKGHVD